MRFQNLEHPLVLRSGAFSPCGKFCRPNSPTAFALLALLAFALFLPRADALTNSTFEASPFSTGWTVVGAPVVTPAITPGSVQGARFSATGQSLAQNVTWGAEWQLDNYFAIRSSASARTYSCVIGIGGQASGINLRYGEGGGFAVFNGLTSTWVALPGLSTIVAAVDANSDGDMNDAGDVKNVYRIRITGHAFGTAGWSYDIELSEAGGTEFTRSVAGLTTYQTVSGATAFPTSITYGTVNGSNPGFWLDEVKSHQELLSAPTIRYLLTDAGNIGGPGLPASAHLSWVVENAETVSISGIGSVAASGTATVAPGTATTYTLTATRFGGTNIATASVAIGVNAAVLPPKITEIQAAEGLLEDEDRDRPDWVELYNPNAHTFVLTGYTLTDAAATPAKWTFPLANIAPGGYAVVFASAKNRAVPGSPLHTNFSLSGSGEYLALSAPGGALVQQFPATYPTPLTFPNQQDRVSYGLDGAGAAKYFKPPTPGVANGTGYDGVVSDTTFSVKRGIYTTAQTVTVASPTAGATIVYTADGTEPTLANGTPVPPANAATPPAVTMTIHPGAIPGGATGVNIASTTKGTTTLRAAAFKTNFAPTNTDTNTYIFPATVVGTSVMSTTITSDPTYGPQMTAALTDLPSMSIVTPSTIVNGTSVLCSLEYIPATGVGVQENAGVELYGGAFTNFAKKSFRVSFKSEYGAAKIEIPSLFTAHARGWKPVEKFDQLELRSGSHDMALRGFYMSNPFTDATMLDAGNLNPHGRFVHMYLNGTYWGMFHLRERWSADLHSAYLGGPASEHESINGNLNVGGWADPGTAYDGDGASWERIKSLRANYAGVKPYLNLRSYVDFQLLYMFGNSENEWRSTGPNGVGSGAKYMMNDSDGYLATASYAASQTQNRPNLRSNPNPGKQAGDGPGSVFSQLWQQGDAEYKIFLADRIHALFFNNGPLTVAANQARLTAMCAEMERAFYAEAARWSAVSATQYRTPSTWATERNNTLNNWFPARGPAYIGYLQGAGYYPALAAPAFGGGTVSAGAVVNFPVSGATIYFTKDGSDPRLAGGAVNPAASIGTGTTISENTWLRARANSGTTWSALNEAFYTVTPLVLGDVIFSEIHFNPQGDDDSEFIELWNRTTHAVNLRGAKFTAGLDYAFPDNRDVPLAPGGRLVLVASLYNFQLRYGINIPVAGVYFDRLGNDGETLTFATAANVALESLHFDDLAPWPDSADGNGYSLVLANAVLPLEAASWRTSIALHGNPGTSDGTVFSGNALADADGDGLPAMCEHLLATSDTNPASGISAMIAGRTLDGRATLTFPRRLSADDLSCIVEVSGDLVTWIADAARTAHVNNGNGTATETWTANGAAGRQFMRVRVTK